MQAATSSPWTMIEPCCGSAAVTLRLCGILRPPVPYQGGKARLAEGVVARIRSRGFQGTPEEVWLSDPSMWGEVFPLLFRSPSRLEVVRQLRAHAIDPLRSFQALQGSPLAQDPAQRVADFLFLQRLAFSGKAVGSAGGAWKSPGFNPTSAYGVQATERFGAIRPQVPAMADLLETWPHHLDGIFVSGSHETCWPDCVAPLPRRCVYLDPPYVNTTPYPDGSLPREEVVELALAWEESGASVLISEAEPVQELVEIGWTAEKIDASRAHQRPFQARTEEWLTMSPMGPISSIHP